MASEKAKTRAKAIEELRQQGVTFDARHRRFECRHCSTSLQTIKIADAKRHTHSVSHLRFQSDARRESQWQHKFDALSRQVKASHKKQDINNEKQDLILQALEQIG